MTRMMELINGWLARYYAVVHSRMAVRLASVRAAVHGDGEENIASFARWYPAIRPRSSPAGRGSARDQSGGRCGGGLNGPIL